MPIKVEDVGIAVRDLDEAVAFLTDVGLTVIGRFEVSGEWADTAASLEATTRTSRCSRRRRSRRLELLEYIHPDVIETEPTRPNVVGTHRVGFFVDDLDAALGVAAGVATYEDVCRLTYLRGLSGLLVIFAAELKKAVVVTSTGELG